MKRMAISLPMRFPRSAIRDGFFVFSVPERHAENLAQLMALKKAPKRISELQNILRGDTVITGIQKP